MLENEYRLTLKKTWVIYKTNKRMKILQSCVLGIFFILNFISIWYCLTSLDLFHIYYKILISIFYSMSISILLVTAITDMYSTYIEYVLNSYNSFMNYFIADIPSLVKACIKILIFGVLQLIFDINILISML